jgi:hypothetical protein
MVASVTDPRFAHRPRNGCGACRQDFSSVELFDRHRVGEHSLDYPAHDNGRRCLDIEEMQAKGWEQDDKGRWTDPARASRVREHLSALGGLTERPAEAQERVRAA